MIELKAGTLVLGVDAADGGRISSLVVDGTERLVTDGDRASGHGAFPMIPWSGRVRHGRFRFRDVDYQLPVSKPPHAIHGTAYKMPWSVVEHDRESVRMEVELGEPWPFGGKAVHTVHVAPQTVHAVLEVHAADRPMPAMAGWHPWFLRPVELKVEAMSMYLRDHEGMPAGTLVAPPPGPWDDCFTGLAAPPVLTWPDGVNLAMASNCPTWVIFTEPQHALCVEPQTGPPDSFTIAPRVVEPGRPLIAAMSWRIGHR